jgi:hypothetical protein
MLAHTINKFNTGVIHKGNKYYRFEQKGKKKPKVKKSVKVPSTPKQQQFLMQNREIITKKAKDLETFEQFKNQLLTRQKS